MSEMSETRNTLKHWTTKSLKLLLTENIVFAAKLTRDCVFINVLQIKVIEFPPKIFFA